MRIPEALEQFGDGAILTRESWAMERVVFRKTDGSWWVYLPGHDPRRMLASPAQDGFDDWTISTVPIPVEYLEVTTLTEQEAVQKMVRVYSYLVGQTHIREETRRVASLIEAREIVETLMADLRHEVYGIHWTSQSRPPQV